MDLLASERASCAVHDDAQSTGTCARCGNFVCPLCLDPDSLDERCAPCREREGADQMPWERPSEPLGRRFTATVMAMLFRPTEAFERSRPGSLTRAVSFNAAISILVVVPFVLLYGTSALLLRDDLVRLTPGATETLLMVSIGFYAIVWFGALLTIPFARGLVFHVVAKMLGGTGSISASVWAANYVGASHLWFVLLCVLVFVPVIGPVLAALGLVALEAIWGVQLSTAAGRYHGLTQGRAIVAGWASFLMWLLPLLGCCGLGALLTSVSPY